MAKFYSKSTGGFYDTDINSEMPGDIKSITQEEYEALLEAQASGYSIQGNDNGDPVAVPLVVDEPPPTLTVVDRIVADPEELAKLRAALGL